MGPDGAGPKVRALLIIDVLNDFCEGGSLAVAGGAELATRITKFVREQRQRYDLVILVREQHVEPGTHFASVTGQPPDFSETWPDHGVAGTLGADFHPNLDLSVLGADAIVAKGQFAAAYSAFDGRVDGHETRPAVALDHLLSAAGVTDVDNAGIAWEYCILATALDGGRRGYHTRVVADLCVAVDSARVPETIEQLRAAGVEVITTAEIAGALQ